MVKLLRGHPYIPLFSSAVLSRAFLLLELSRTEVQTVQSSWERHRPYIKLLLYTNSLSVYIIKGQIPQCAKPHNGCSYRKVCQRWWRKQGEHTWAFKAVARFSMVAYLKTLTRENAIYYYMSIKVIVRYCFSQITLKRKVLNDNE